MKLRLLLLLSMLQWSFSCFSVQAITTPVVYYGKVLSGGKGIANVPVTDGTQIVLTDDKGRYSISSTSNAEYIYITLPDGYNIPMKGKVPAFFQKVPAQPSKKVHFDFELTPSSTDNKKHVLVVWADPQVYFDEEMPQVQQASKDVKELLATNYQGIPAYGIVCGDIIGDINKKPSYFTPMIDAIAETEIPFFYVIGTTSWANPKFKFKSEYVSPVKTGDYTVQICDSLWLNRSFRKVMEEKIMEAPLKQKRYVYSDVGFILLGMLVEQLAGMPMEAYLQREFYEPMGLEHTGYLPLRRFAKSEIVPSNKDRFLRKETLQGFVHDEASAFFGGLAGNAGLFSTARDVARVYQMLLNGGEIDGQRYLSKETCQLFTTETSKISRRGLGFDKPDADDPKKGNCAPAAPAGVYGHTGFTGTCAWVDPVNELVYVFLSNRIYPDVTNRKLNQLHIRERIQGAIYDAMKKK